MLDELAPGLWTVSAPLKLAGAEFGTRMSVVRIAEGRLALIAPVAIDETLAGELAALGEVKALVAPNAFHHFYFTAAAARYPQAACYLAEGVAAKLSATPGGRLAAGIPLSSEPVPLWRDVLDQCRLEGSPLTNEVVFHHRASKTLILTDLCFHFDPAPTGWTGLFLRLAGAHGRLAVSRLMRAGLRDRERVRASIARILEWDFDRIIVAHGQLVLRDGHARFREATRDL